jgi:capsule biosynthesis phosphatase
MKQMRICWDCDGVIAKGGYPYDQCTPYPEAVKVLRQLKNEGHYIIILTARYMSKYKGNKTKAAEEGYNELSWWLDEHQIPYDEIHFGKPSAHIYIDDRALRVVSDVDNWQEKLKEIQERASCEFTNCPTHPNC